MKVIIVALATFLLASCVLSKEFCDDKADGKYPVPGNCRQYWKCTNHKTQKLTCPTGHKFDEHKHECVPGACPKSAKEFCDDKADGKYPVPGSCNQYWKCTNRKTEKLTCPRGQKFDAHKRECVVGHC